MSSRSDGQLFDDANAGAQRTRSSSRYAPPTTKRERDPRAVCDGCNLAESSIRHQGRNLCVGCYKLTPIAAPSPLEQQVSREIPSCFGLGWARRIIRLAELGGHVSPESLARAREAIDERKPRAYIDDGAE